MNTRHAAQPREAATPNLAILPPAPWQPPDGIYYEHNRQRPNKPYMLRWSTREGARSKSFATQEEREKVARKLAKDREEYGREILTFDAQEWRKWLDFKTASNGADPMAMLTELRTLREAYGLPTDHAPMTIAAAVDEYLAFRQTGKIAHDTLTHLQAHLRDRFAGALGAMPLPRLTPDALSGWLDSLRRMRQPKIGTPVDALTKRHHRKSVHIFLEWCFRTRGWITRNPCDAVPVPYVPQKDVRLLTVDDGRRLFAANADHPVAPRMALEAFGFLRASSAGRLRKSWINFAERGIRLFGPEHKSGKTKWRDGHTDNLWAWLSRATEATWEMTEDEYRREKAKAFLRAGIDEGSANRLRRTCISAHLAWKKNRPLTAELAQHSSTSITETYVGVMSEADGRAWFDISPTDGASVF